MTDKGRRFNATGTNQEGAQTGKEYNPDDEKWVLPDIESLIDELLERLKKKIKRVHNKK